MSVNDILMKKEKDKWAYRLRERMKDRRAPVPEGLWERIESRLDEAAKGGARVVGDSAVPLGGDSAPSRLHAAEPAANAGGGKGRRGMTVRMKTWLSAAAAVAALLLAFHVMQGGDSERQSEPVLADNKVDGNGTRVSGNAPGNAAAARGGAEDTHGIASDVHDDVLAAHHAAPNVGRPATDAASGVSRVRNGGARVLAAADSGSLYGGVQHDDAYGAGAAHIAAEPRGGTQGVADTVQVDPGIRRTGCETPEDDLQTVSLQPQLMASRDRQPTRHANATAKSSAEERQDAHDGMTTADAAVRAADDGSQWTLAMHTGTSVAETNRGMHSAMAAAYVRHPAMRSLAGVHDIVCDDRFVVGEGERLAPASQIRKHSHPVSLGLSVGYGLGNRLGLVTGLVYTYTSTDIMHAGQTADVVQHQTYRYIGVPLYLRYKALDLRRLNVYAAAGGQVDFNFSAKSKSASSDYNSISKDQPVYSLGVSAGVQYDVLPHLGLYAEPGVRYYFNNASGVENIFKEKQWNLGIQLGLRFDL